MDTQRLEDFDAGAVKAACFEASLSQHQERVLAFVFLAEHHHQCSAATASICWVVSPWEMAVQPQQVPLSVWPFLTSPTSGSALLLSNPDSLLVHLLGHRLLLVLCTAPPRPWGSHLGLWFPQQQEVKSQSQEREVGHERLF